MFPGHLQASLQATASWRVRVLRVSFMRPTAAFTVPATWSAGGHRAHVRRCWWHPRWCGGAWLRSRWVRSTSTSTARSTSAGRITMPNVFAREHNAFTRETVQGQRNRSAVSGRARRPCAGMRITAASPAEPSCLPSTPRPTNRTPLAQHPWPPALAVAPLPLPVCSRSFARC
jgi:hypothetical protein